MIIRHTIAALTLLITFTLTAQKKAEYHCLWGDCGFEPNQLVYLFGDQVKLRAEPDTDSKVLDYMKIGHPVRILQQTQVNKLYNGYESPFYEVYYDGMTGYVLGSLLSLERKTLGDTNYLFSFKQKGDDTFLLIRNVGLDGQYKEQQIKLANAMITIESQRIEGIDGLDEIFYIDYLAEACGVEGGVIYLFPTSKGSFQSVELSEVSEAGIFWYSETFIFPDDANGEPNTIVYKKETFKNLDEASEWTETTAMTRKLKWIDGKLAPNPIDSPSVAQ